MAVYAYVRASTKQQVEDGETLGVQERMISGYAMMHGLEIKEVFVEKAVSGGKPFAERPEAGRAVEVMRRGDILIAAKLDRAFRDTADALATLEHFRDHGLDLHLLDLGGSVIKSGVSELIFTILVAAAKFERHRIRERILDNKSDSKARGLYLGGHRPFGWQVIDGVLVEDPQEQAARFRILEMRAGGASLRAIARAMTHDGLPITHTGVRGVLEQEAARAA